jgi:hypothetical protein
MALAKPRAPSKTFQEPDKVYTLRTNPNTILVASPKLKRTAVLAFRNESCAFELARLMESHYSYTKEWPNLDNGRIKFYDDGRKDVMFVEVDEWNNHDLTYICGVRFMNMIIIDKFEKNKSLSGNYKEIEVHNYFYQDYLNYIWNIQA